MPGSKTLTVAAYGPQRVMIPFDFTPDACRVTARAVAGAVGAAFARRQPIHSPSSFAQAIASTRAAAWIEGPEAWARQVERDLAQAEQLEEQRLGHAPRPGEPRVRDALVMVMTTTEGTAWQTVRNTLGHPFWRDIPSRHQTEACGVCEAASALNMNRESSPEQEALAAHLLRLLDATGALVLDLYAGLRASDPPSCREAEAATAGATSRLTPAPSVIRTQTTDLSKGWEPEVWPL
jgi:hypothetical protein